MPPATYYLSSTTHDVSHNNLLPSILLTAPYLLSTAYCLLHSIHSWDPLYATHYVRYGRLGISDVSELSSDPDDEFEVPPLVYAGPVSDCYAIAM